MAKKSKKSSGVSEADSEVKPEKLEEELEAGENGEENAGKKSLLGFMSNSDTDETESEPKPEEESGTEETEDGRVLMESMWPSRLIVRNTPSGEEYVWSGAGAVVSVHPDDVEFLAQKNRKIRACCGSSGERKYFNM